MEQPTLPRRDRVRHRRTAPVLVDGGASLADLVGAVPFSMPSLAVHHEGRSRSRDASGGSSDVMVSDVDENTS